ncbi:MAG TPA: HisA/HisF-related TIM barrel protein, partial [Gemmata sp.]
MSAQHTRPRLIPVLDVMNGRVVRAVGGVRANYRPIVCPATGRTNPFDVAQTLLARARANELYVADLDAITGPGAVSPAVRALLDACEVPIWLDAGIGRTDVLDFPETLNLCPVVGFETCRVPEILLEALTEPLRRPVAFSIDLKNGQ